MMVAAAVLVGCGGGGGGSAAKEAGQLSSTPTYVAAAATVGDYYTWEFVSRGQGATADSYSYSTRLVRSVASDGAMSAAYLGDYISSSSPLAYVSNTNITNFDSLGRWLNTSNGSCTATATPPFYPIAPYKVTVGMSTQTAGIVQGKCSNNPAEQHSYDFKDKVFPMEQVTVPAGIFNVLKVVRNGIEEDGNVRQVTEQTCWWEPDLGIDVKCVTNFTNTNKTTGESRSRVDTETLQGYSKQKLARKFDTVMRFMGNWNGRYDGIAQGRNVSGLCKLMFDGGNITGNCVGSAVEFMITGTVNADGSVFFTAANNGNVGSTFTGKFDNIQQLSGSWSAPNYASGTWVMTQD